MKEILEFAGYKVPVNSETLKFDEMTLSDYIQKESAYYDNFGGYLALAEKYQHGKEVDLEKMIATIFVDAKECGGSDKLAEAKAKSDDRVTAYKKEIVDAKYIVSRLKQHLRAWDKNHDNAQSMGHMLRKQMDKLHGDIMVQTRSHGHEASAITPNTDEKTKVFSSDLGIDGLV